MAELGSVRSQQGRTSEAIKYLNESLTHRSDFPIAMNNLAWIYATRSKSPFYDPKQAVHIARTACELTNYENPGLLDTLAVAYASANDFPQAIATTVQAIQLADAAGDANLARELKTRMELFKAGEKFEQNPSVAP